ncbi:hypothetical protein Tsubulata_013631 [Turnera subulata]|uniref:Transmembrane protein n=1 Tax=Turnera subulata TaxID=218843 RepID=A0A9Q0J2Y1_9ROSI|nr:hypothetical protein Tsubulata_013631 [Turnera subulata]
MGLFAHTIAAAGFILIGAWESFTSPSTTPATQQNPTPPPLNHFPKPVPKPNQKTQTSSSSSFVVYVFLFVFSLLFVINSLVSLVSAVRSRDRVGLALQLQIIGVAGVFILYSVLGISSKVSSFIRFPPPILNLVVLFGFVEEFLLFYMRRKDVDGIENRYFDLMLVPIGVCVVSTVLELKSDSGSGNGYARLGRGVGLVLQGTWFMQMGISFYTNLMVQGCSLHEKSRGNYTIKCKGHPEYHRARGIATLQFNCHLALLVVLVMAGYSTVAKHDGDRGEFTRYKPLGAEMQQMENHGRFTLDSDEEDEIKEEEEEAVRKVNGGVVEMGVNGHAS